MSLYMYVVYDKEYVIIDLVNVLNIYYQNLYRAYTYGMNPQIFMKTTRYTLCSHVS